MPINKARRNCTLLMMPGSGSMNWGKIGVAVPLPPVGQGQEAWLILRQWLRQQMLGARDRIHAACCEADSKELIGLDERPLPGHDDRPRIRSLDARDHGQHRRTDDPQLFIL